MAGGGDTPQLVGAVSEAGALGSIGAAYLTPEQIVQTARAVRALTSRPFGVNLFAPAPILPSPDAGRALERVAPFFAELRLPPPPPPPPIPREAFAQQLGLLGIGCSVQVISPGKWASSNLSV